STRYNNWSSMLLHPYFSLHYHLRLPSNTSTSCWHSQIIRQISFTPRYLAAIICYSAAAHCSPLATSAGMAMESYWTLGSCTHSYTLDCFHKFYLCSNICFRSKFLSQNVCFLSENILYAISRRGQGSGHE